MTLTLYGIPNCDTVRKARRWLNENAVEHLFHDFRVDGLDRKDLESWLERVDWDTVINRRSSSWKNLEPAVREAMDTEGAITAALAAPTLIKRPVLVAKGVGKGAGKKTGESDSIDLLEFGFTPARYTALFLSE